MCEFSSLSTPKSHCFNYGRGGCLPKACRPSYTGLREASIAASASPFDWTFRRIIDENGKVSLPHENPEFQRPVPADGDLEDYLLPEELFDATLPQVHASPVLPHIEEVSSAVESATCLLTGAAEDSGRQKSAFEHLVQLLSFVEREFFERPCFGESPLERLRNSTLATELIASDLANAQRLIRITCSKNGELVTHQFFEVVMYHLQRTTRSTVDGHEIVLFDDQTPENTFKAMLQLREDCSLAADQLIREAGFARAAPTPDGPDRVDETLAGLSEESSRQAYALRRDADDIPRIDLGSLRSKIKLHHVELVADSLEQVALAELLCAQQFGFEVIKSLSMAEARAVELRDRLQVYRQLIETAEELSKTLADSEAWTELTGMARRAYERMRGTDLRFSKRVVSNESVAAARAELERAEQIRFTAAKLLARDEHPEIKYKPDPITKAASAISLAAELVDSGKHIRKLHPRLKIE